MFLVALAFTEDFFLNYKLKGKSSEKQHADRKQYRESICLITLVGSRLHFCSTHTNAYEPSNTGLHNAQCLSQTEDLSNQIICWRHIRAWNPAAQAPFRPSSMYGIMKLNSVASGRPLSFARPCFSRTAPLSGVTRVLLIALKRGISRGGQ